MDSQPQTIDAIASDDIVITGDLTEAAETMTDKEMRALVISNYQMLREILAFCRDLQATLNAVSQNGGPMGAMVRGMRP